MRYSWRDADAWQTIQLCFPLLGLVYMLRTSSYFLVGTTGEAIPNREWLILRKTSWAKIITVFMGEIAISDLSLFPMVLQMVHKTK